MTISLLNILLTNFMISVTRSASAELKKTSYFVNLGYAVFGMPAVEADLEPSKQDFRN